MLKWNLPAGKYEYGGMALERADKKQRQMGYALKKYNIDIKRF